MKFGLLAGRGLYPVLLARRLVEDGHSVVVVGLAGQYAKGSVPDALAETIAPVGALGKAASFFTKHGVTDGFMAGGVMRKGVWRYVRPDMMAMLLLPRVVFKGDDFLLREVAKKFEKCGIKIKDPSRYLETDFAGQGHIAGGALPSDKDGDLRLAWEAAIAHGRSDKGQTVIVHKGRVVGLEGRRGTDALLSCAPGPGAVMAKVVKPGQDRRFDMPAIGPSTAIIASMVGLRAIIVEAGGVLLIDKERLFAVCNRTGVCLVGK